MYVPICRGKAAPEPISIPIGALELASSVVLMAGRELLTIGRAQLGGFCLSSTVCRHLVHVGPTVPESLSGKTLAKGAGVVLTPKSPRRWSQ